MTQLTRREALKVAAAGLLLPVVVPGGGGALVKRPMPQESDTHELVGVGIGDCARFTQDTLDTLIGRYVNADEFLGCPPGTLLGTRFVAAPEDKAPPGMWRYTWSLEERPGGWSMPVYDNGEVIEFMAYGSRPMCPAGWGLICNCRSVEWTMNGKTVYRAAKRPTIRSKPCTGEEDGKGG